MKLYDIQHINESHNPRKVMGEELRFIYSIGSTSGKMCRAEKQPKDWDHVRRLVNMLFLAWNDDDPVKGVVYLGEFFTPESEDEKFYKFFENFNGFTINKWQMDVFISIGKSYRDLSIPRRKGMTTFALTYVAWLSLKGDDVIFATRNRHMATRCKNIYFENCNRANIKPLPVDIVVVEDGRYDICGKVYDTAIYDCSGDTLFDWWTRSKCYIKQSRILLNTIDYV